MAKKIGLGKINLGSESSDAIRLSVLCAGDFMCHGDQIRMAKTETGYDFSSYFENTSPYIQAADLSIINFETTMSGGEPAGFPRFNAPDDAAKAVAAAGFTVAATANNHAYDTMTPGVLRTREILEQNGLLVAGTRCQPEDKAYVVLTVKGIKTAILNYTLETARRRDHKTLNNHIVEDDAQDLINSFGFDTLEEDIRRMETDMADVRREGAEVVIVYFHWGNEYDRYSLVFQRYLAYRAANMGADVIFGSHPHVLQEYDEINVVVEGKNKTVPVFYSLGNYIWGVRPMPGRETVLNGALALATLAVDPASKSVLSIETGYVPTLINIDLAQQNKGRYGVLSLLDMTGKSAAQFEAAEQRGTMAELMEEIDQTLRGKVHPAPYKFHFERIMELPVGEAMSVADILPKDNYVRFFSEDAAIVSALQNGYLMGNAPGYTGITATGADGTEHMFMVRVVGSGKSTLPILVDDNNLMRDIYLPLNLVRGEQWELPDDIQLCKPAAAAWVAMKKAAHEAGIELACVSGFRSKRGQLDRRNRYAKVYGDEKADLRYHRYGFTEHHLGLALDATNAPDSSTTREQAILWLDKNAFRYGFAPRRSSAAIKYRAYTHLRYYPQRDILRAMQSGSSTLHECLINKSIQGSDVHRQIVNPETCEFGKDPELTLSLICRILGIEVPEQFQAVKDQRVPCVTSSANTFAPGCVFFYDPWLRNEMNVCRDALKKGALLAIAHQQICDETGKMLPTIVVDDPVLAFSKVGRYIRYCYPAKVIAVTGSAGKSTTTELIGKVLSQDGSVHMTKLNNANSRKWVLKILQQLQPSHKYYVQEAGASFPQHVWASSYMLNPDVAIITNIGTAHLDLYKTRDKYVADKLSMLENVSPTGIKILNIDDEILAGYAGGERTISISLRNLAADYWCEEIDQRADGLYVTVVESASGTRTKIRMRVAGDHNSYNILAAFAVGRYYGLSEEKIVKGISDYQSSGTHQALYSFSGINTYLSCFSAIDLSLISSLRTLSSMKCAPGSRKIAAVWQLDRVAGHEEEVYPPIAEQIRDLDIDTLLLFGEGTRVLEECLRDSRIHVLYEDNILETAEHIRAITRPGDIILFNGNHTTSIVLTLDLTFGTTYCINSQNERKTRVSVFREKEWTGACFDDTLCVLDRYEGSAAEIVIPDRLNDLPLTHINDSVFKGSDVQTVKLGANVVSICREAFKNAEKLETVLFNKALVRIGESAFEGCSSLEEIQLPRSCTHIESRAFADCKNLRRVLVPKNIGYIAPDAFEGSPVSISVEFNETAPLA